MSLTLRLEKLLRRQGKIQGHGSDIEEVAQEELPSPFAPRKSTAFRRKGGHKVVNWDAIDRNVMTEVGYCNVTYKWMSLHANVYVVLVRHSIQIHRVFLVKFLDHC